MGCAVLPGWHPRLGREGGRRPRRWDRARSSLPRPARGRAPPTSGASPGRRRVVRLVLLRLMPMPNGSLDSILVLGAVHGINPAMGWLFAVSLGLQAQSGRAVWRALGPLALGHALAVAAALVVAAAVGVVVPLSWLRWMAAGALLGFGVFHLVSHRHPRSSRG